MRPLFLLVAAFAFAFTGCDSTSSSSDCHGYSCGGGDGNGKDHSGGGTDGGGTDGGGTDNGGGTDGGGTDGGGTDGGGTDGGGTDGGGDGTDDLFIEVHPRQTYLRTEQDGAIDAPAIALSNVGLKAGDTVCLSAVGDYLLQPGQLASQRSGPKVTAIFSADNQLAASDRRVRLDKAVDAGDDVDTPPTFFEQFPTDVSQDFDATASCVTIPDGANYLFLATFDTFYGDNDVAPGTSQPFGVRFKR